MCRLMIPSSSLLLSARSAPSPLPEDFCPSTAQGMGPRSMDSLRGSFVKLKTKQRRLVWPLRKDDTHKSRSVNKRTWDPEVPAVFPFPARPYDGKGGGKGGDKGAAAAGRQVSNPGGS